MKAFVLATHPIQYQAPWFRALAATGQIDLVVAYGLLPSPDQQSVGFGVAFGWDLPLLEGYRSFVLRLSNGEPSLGRFFGLRAADLALHLDRERPDVMILPGWNSWILVQGLLAARRRRLPIVMRSEANDLRRRPRWVQSLQRWIVRSATAHLAIGSANRRFLRAREVEDATIFDAPYFVDNARFSAEAERLRGEREALREAWGVSPGAICLLFAGKLVAKKRPEDLVAASMRVKGSPLHLLFAGEGALRSELAEAARSSGVPSTFTGFLNQREMPRAYAASDLLILPSDAGETWGLVVNEAMASGRPAIVSKLVGCGEDLIDDGNTGWQFPCGDVDALANRLTSAAALGRPGLAELGDRARRRIEREFTIERSVGAALAACRFAAAGLRA